MRKKGEFKSKGAQILAAGKRPDNMGDFLELNPKTDATVARDTRANAPILKSANAQSCISPPPPPLVRPPKTHQADPSDTSDGSKTVTRLHVHIRKDLADALFQEVFRRKTDASVSSKKATQRVIIEQALEGYLKGVKNHRESNA